jgi:benzoate membrane transport protein
MVTGLSDMSIEAAVGAFLFSSVLLVSVGVSGLFERLVKMIPTTIAAALLAGVLTPFAIQAMAGLNNDLWLGLIMLISFFGSQLWWPRYSVLITLSMGLLVALQQNQNLFSTINLHLANPVWVTPKFDITAIISLGVPLFIVTMASQNLPGIAALRAANYQVPASPLVGWTGFTGLLTAPFGGFAYNLAAITAAICMTDDVDKDPTQRFRAAVWAGGFYLLVGCFASSITSLFFALPKTLMLMLAGLALMGTIASSLNTALAAPQQRLAATITFITTASGLVIAGIGSAFWGLVFGLLVNAVLERKR